jgi:hypothetical protein
VDAGSPRSAGSIVLPNPPPLAPVPSHPTPPPTPFLAGTCLLLEPPGVVHSLFLFPALLCAGICTVVWRFMPLLCLPCPYHALARWPHTCCCWCCAIDVALVVVSTLVAPFRPSLSFRPPVPPAPATAGEPRVGVASPVDFKTSLVRNRATNKCVHDDSDCDSDCDSAGYMMLSGKQHNCNWLAEQAVVSRAASEWGRKGRGGGGQMPACTTSRNTQTEGRRGALS